MEKPEIYELVREKDVTGVSGTGTVAVVISVRGSCLVFWKTATKSAVYYNSLDEVKQIHCHAGHSHLEQVTEFGKYVVYLEQFKQVVTQTLQDGENILNALNVLLPYQIDDNNQNVTYRK
jgi:hypothetical protein